MDHLLINFTLIFLLFLSYSVIGYIVEIITCTLNKKQIVLNRGFLIGPYLPVFGTGAMMIVFMLDKYENDIIALFVLGVVICTIVEYLTSLIMEKLFKIRWWDYSNMKFNVDGRVCLLNSILFGIGGIIIIKIVNPLLIDLFKLLPQMLIILVCFVLLIIFVSDFVISTVTLFKLKLNAHMFTSRDATDEVKQKIKDKLNFNIVFVDRTLGAFPNLGLFNKKEIIEFKEFIKNLKRDRKLGKKKKALHK